MEVVMSKRPLPAATLKPIAPAPTVDLRREMAALRAAQAPVIFFEVGSSFGVRNGVGNITLDGGMHIIVDGQNVKENRTVAHLRFPVTAIPSLREALDGIEQLLKPVPQVLKN
jgi:hypothetical protein